MALFGMFGAGDPAKKANKYLDQIPGVGQQYYNPYIQGGAQAGQTLEGEYGKMLDPTSFMDAIMKHFSESQGAKYEQDQLGRSIGNTAAAGGYAGTPEHQRQYGEMASNLMSKDMQQYLQNALGIYNSGINGEQDFFGKGFDASKDLTDLMGGALSSKAGLSFQNQSQQNANTMGLLNAITKAFSQSAGASAGGV